VEGLAHAPSEGGALGKLIRMRRTIRDWKNCNIEGKPIRAAELSSRLAKVAAYRQTICEVEAGDYLLRKINKDEDARCGSAHLRRIALENADGASQDFGLTGVNPQSWGSFPLGNLVPWPCTQAAGPSRRSPETAQDDAAAAATRGEHGCEGAGRRHGFGRRGAARPAQGTEAAGNCAGRAHSRTGIAEPAHLRRFHHDGSDWDPGVFRSGSLKRGAGGGAVFVAADLSAADLTAAQFGSNSFLFHLPKH
jgi:hypothetical protein